MHLKHPHVICPSYIDDICLLVEGDSPEETMTKLEGAVVTCFEWGKENAVAFDDPKSKLILVNPKSIQTSRVTLYAVQPGHGWHGWGTTVPNIDDFNDG